MRTLRVPWICWTAQQQITPAPPRLLPHTHFSPFASSTDAAILECVHLMRREDSSVEQISHHTVRKRSTRDSKTAQSPKHSNRLRGGASKAWLHRHTGQRTAAPRSSSRRCARRVANIINNSMLGEVGCWYCSWVVRREVGRWKFRALVV